MLAAEKARRTSATGRGNRHDALGVDVGKEIHTTSPAWPLLTLQASMSLWARMDSARWADEVGIVGPFATTYASSEPASSARIVASVACSTPGRVAITSGLAMVVVGELAVRGADFGGRANQGDVGTRARGVRSFHLLARLLLARPPLQLQWRVAPSGRETRHAGRHR
jgi:hypothetical protein